MLKYILYCKLFIILLYFGDVIPSNYIFIFPSIVTSRDVT